MRISCGFKDCCSRNRNNALARVVDAEFDSENYPALQVIENKGRNCVAGRQGFEFGAKRFSKLVMARDFWF